MKFVGADNLSIWMHHFSWVFYTHGVAVKGTDGFWQVMPSALAVHKIMKHFDKNTLKDLEGFWAHCGYPQDTKFDENAHAKLHLKQLEQALSPNTFRSHQSPLLQLRPHLLPCYQAMPLQRLKTLKIPACHERVGLMKPSNACGWKRKFPILGEKALERQIHLDSTWFPLIL